MPDRQMPFERREVTLVEHLRDEAHVLDHGDGLAVADGDTGRLLPAVLQRVQTEVRLVRDGLRGCVHPEHAARFAWMVVVLVGFAAARPRIPLSHPPRALP